MKCIMAPRYDDTQLQIEIHEVSGLAGAEYLWASFCPGTGVLQTLEVVENLEDVFRTITFTCEAERRANRGQSKTVRVIDGLVLVTVGDSAIEAIHRLSDARSPRSSLAFHL
jgi:hypothetical protein